MNRENEYKQKETNEDSYGKSKQGKTPEAHSAEKACRLPVESEVGFFLCFRRKLT